MRDNYWRPDMGGTDWTGVLERYRPLVERLGSHDDLMDLLWEVQGELGTSHAYVIPKLPTPDRTNWLGGLGADQHRDDDGTWRVANIIPGESSDPRARSPLVAPGVDVRVGDALLAVDGRQVPWPCRRGGGRMAGSDGDIVNAAIQALGIGRVVGTRTWGGVVGIDMKYRLLDGTHVTQPRYAFWLEGKNWGVENYGVDPDIEVVVTPQDRVAGRDPQLDAAIGLALEQLERQPAAAPPAMPEI